MATKKTTPKPSLEERVKKDPKLLARVLKNPGLRSKLSDSALTKYAPAMAKQRQMAVRLKTPITPGSTTTERDLAREAQAAMTQKYAPLENQQRQALGEEQTRTRDVGGFYDQYLRQVAQHSQNVQAIGQQAAQVGQGTQNAVTGLAQADLSQLQNPAVADARVRGVQAGDLSQMASNAAAVRQSLVGSFVAQQAGQNAANQNYADTLAHVVAPGQQLGARAIGLGRERQAREDIATTARERGAADTAYRAERRAEEAKQVLARQTLAGTVADKAADNALAVKKTIEDARHNAAQETAAEKRAREKKERDDAKAAADATKAAAKGKEPNKYGFPADQWARWSSSHRQREIDKFNKTGGKAGKPGKGPEWVTPGQSGKAMTQLTTLKDFATRARDGLKFKPTGKEKGPDPKARLNRAQARTKVLQNTGSLMHPALLDAALDAVYNPGSVISASTVRALITAGYKPSEVANTLGAKTAGQIPSYNDRVKSGEVAGPPAPKR